MAEFYLLIAAGRSPGRPWLFPTGTESRGRNRASR